MPTIREQDGKIYVEYPRVPFNPGANEWLVLGTLLDLNNSSSHVGLNFIISSYLLNNNVFRSKYDNQQSLDPVRKAINEVMQSGKCPDDPETQIEIILATLSRMIIDDKLNIVYSR